MDVRVSVLNPPSGYILVEHIEWSCPQHGINHILSQLLRRDEDARFSRPHAGSIREVKVLTATMIDGANVGREWQILAVGETTTKFCILFGGASYVLGSVKTALELGTRFRFEICGRNRFAEVAEAAIDDAWVECRYVCFEYLETNLERQIIEAKVRNRCRWGT